MAENGVQLDSLPNCVLLYLLSYLDATSLYFLSRTSDRLAFCIENCKALWRRIDARRPPNRYDKIVYCLARVHQQTHTLLLSGTIRSDALLASCEYAQFRNFNYLRVLAIENQQIDSFPSTITMFPALLHELSLKRTCVNAADEFFRCSSNKMEQLKVLILDECQWVTSSAFLSISKYPSLQILSLYKCKNLENSIPYFSMSFMMGFKNLKVIDGRLSSLCETFVRSIYKSKSLVAIYLQSDDVSYKLDYYKRKLAIVNGDLPRYEFQKDEEEFPVTDVVEDDEEPHGEEPFAISDGGLVDFLTTMSTKEFEEPLPSALFTDAYSHPCTCQFQRRPDWKRIQKPGKKPDDDSSDDDDDDDNSKHKNAIYLELMQKKIDRLTDLVHMSNLNRNRGRTMSLTPSQSIVLPIRNGADYFEIELPPRRSQYRRRSPSSSPTDESGPSRKRRRRNSAGPSNGFHWSSSSDDDDEESGAARPATPRPGPAPPQIIYPVAIQRLGDQRPEIDGHPYPDFEVRLLRGLPRQNEIPLKRLSLRGHRFITDATLDYIKELHLDVLDLTYTNCTVSGINKYLLFHPQCRVLHERFCVCLPIMHF